MEPRCPRSEPAAASDADRDVAMLLAEHERMSEAWRRQLQLTLQGFDELETQRRAMLAAAASVPGATLDEAVEASERVLPALPVLLAAYERNLLQWALARTGGNQKEAAALLGIRPTTLHEKLKRLRVSVPCRCGAGPSKAASGHTHVVRAHR